MIQILLGIALWYFVYKWFKKNYSILAKEKRYTPEEFYTFLEQGNAIRGNDHSAKMLKCGDKLLINRKTKAGQSQFETVFITDRREIDVVSDEEWEEFLVWRKQHPTNKS